MSTIVANLSLTKTETRNRATLLTVRTAHGDVDQSSHVEKILDPGDTITFYSSSFFYAYLRDKVDVVEVEMGTPPVVTSLTDVVGLLTFPCSCRVTFSVPATAVNTIPRHIEAIYS